MKKEYHKTETERTGCRITKAALTGTLLRSFAILTIFALSAIVKVSAQSGGLLWETNMKGEAGAAIQRDDSYAINTSDGGHVGLYTASAGEKLFEGRIIKFDASGTVLWEKTIQFDQYTTANRVTEGSEGDLYVAGTTVSGGKRYIYLACYGADGYEIAKNVFTTELGSYSLIASVEISNGKVVVSGYDDNKCFFYVADEDCKLQSEHTSYVEALVQDAYIIGNHVIANSTKEIITLDLTTGKTRQFATGSFSRSAKVGDAFYILKNNSYNRFDCIKYIEKDGELVTDWSTGTGLQFDFYVNYIFADKDENIYVLNKTENGISVAKLDKNGNFVWSNENVLSRGVFSKATGFIYELGVDRRGNIHLLGMNNYKVYLAELSSSGNFVSDKEFVPDNNYSYAYTLYDQSVFDGEKFFITGYHLKVDAKSDYETYFAQIDPENSTTVEWVYQCILDKISNIIPAGGTADKDGNFYALAVAGDTPMVQKYDNTGRLVWNKEIPITNGTGGVLSSIAILDNNNIVVTGSCMTSNRWYSYEIVYVLSPDGEILFSKHFESEDLWTATAIGLEKTDDGGFIAFYYVQDGRNLQFNVRMEKFDSEFNREWVKDLSEKEDFCPYFVKKDEQGNFLIGGQMITDETYKHMAALMKCDKEGNVIFWATSDEGVYGEEGRSELYDAWTDSKGITYAVGGTLTQGLLFKINEEGVITDSKVTNEEGYYNSIANIGDTPILIGTFINPDNGNSIDGCITALGEDGKEAWTKRHGEDGSDTYFLFGFAGDYLTVTGYSQNNSSVTEKLFVFDGNGNFMKEVAASKISSPTDYAFVNSFKCDDNIFTLSRYGLSFDSSITCGRINCFGIKESTGIGSLNVSDGDIKIVRTGDKVYATGNGIKSLNVCTVNGSVVRTVNGNVIGLAGLPKGVYIIKAESNTGNKSVKITM